MSPALNGSSALQRFERSNAIEIRNGIMFDFYPGLPQMCASTFSFLKAYTKHDVVNSCLANPDNEAVIHSATCTTNL